MKTKNIIQLSVATIVGVAMIVYGGYDDSPGAQLLGLVLIVMGILAV